VNPRLTHKPLGRSCAYCSKPFKSASELSSHQKWCHVTSWCACGVGFKLPQNLRGHLRKALPGAHAADAARIEAERAQRILGGWDWRREVRRKGAKKKAAADEPPVVEGGEAAPAEQEEPAEEEVEEGDESDGEYEGP